MNLTADDHDVLNQYIVYGKLSICKVQGKPVKSKKKPIHIINLTPTSVTFQTDLKFPVMPECELKLEICIDNDPIVIVNGYLEAVEKEWDQYICLLHICEVSHIGIMKLLKFLFLKQHPLIQKAHESYHYFTLLNGRKMKAGFDLTT